MSPRAIVLEPGPAVVDLDMTFVDLAGAAMSPQVPIETLGAAARGRVRRSRPVHRPHDLDHRLRNSVLRVLERLQRPLRSGEALRFERSSGEMRTVRLEPDHLTMSFNGRVEGMKIGSDESPRSLMPTWLDWLRAQHGLSLLWGTTVYLFGIGLAIVRWFKVP